LCGGLNSDGKEIKWDRVGSGDVAKYLPNLTRNMSCSYFIGCLKDEQVTPADGAESLQDYISIIQRK
jgi:hypothetical protein